MPPVCHSRKGRALIVKVERGTFWTRVNKKRKKKKKWKLGEWNEGENLESRVACL